MCEEEDEFLIEEMQEVSEISHPYNLDFEMEGGERWILPCTTIREDGAHAEVVATHERQDIH